MLPPFESPDIVVGIHPNPGTAARPWHRVRGLPSRLVRPADPGRSRPAPAIGLRPSGSRGCQAGAMTAAAGEPLLTEESALEVLAFLVTAARTQTEEAAEYGPMRLLMGARLLARHMQDGVRDDEALRALVEEIAALEPVRTPTRDRQAYLSSLDALCVRVADTLLAHAGR